MLSVIIFCMKLNCRHHIYIIYKYYDKLGYTPTFYYNIINSNSG